MVFFLMGNLVKLPIIFIRGKPRTSATDITSIQQIPCAKCTANHLPEIPPLYLHFGHR